MSLPSQVVATAPGKLILMGEHSAVYRRPALVVSVGLETRVRLTVREGALGGASNDALEGARVRLVLRDLDVDEVSSWAEIKSQGDDARRAWSDCVAGSDSSRLDRLRAADPAHVVKVALAETVRALQVEPPGIDVDLTSELPIGAGLGSSASVAVATIGALVALLGREVDPDLVDRIALEVERRQHGRPSGVDHGTILRGGVQWAEWNEGGELRCETLSLAPGALDPLVVFHTGTPSESTGAVVEFVRRRFENRSGELEALLTGMESRVVDLRSSLTTQVSPDHVVRLFRAFERDLEALGVVPEEVCSTVRQIEALGAAAKISGAGGLTGPEAGSLLAYDPEDSLDGATCIAHLRRFAAPLGVPGLAVNRSPLSSRA